MNEQKVIDEIRETYKNTYANCIYVMTSMMIGVEDENKRLREALERIADEDDTVNYGHELPIIAREALNG